MKVREIIIIVGILLISLASYLIIEFTKKPGETVIVKVNGTEVATYSLNVDGIYEINNGTNILHIEDGYAWLDDANCPDKLCVKSGRISKDGETITCLPNKVSIIVSGEKDFVDLVG